MIEDPLSVRRCAKFRAKALFLKALGGGKAGLKPGVLFSSLQDVYLSIAGSESLHLLVAYLMGTRDKKKNAR